MFFKATLYPNLAWSLGSFIELRITPKPRKERTSKKKGQRNRSLMDICLLTKKDIVEDGKCCLAWVSTLKLSLINLGTELKYVIHFDTNGYKSLKFMKSSCLVRRGLVN